MRSVIKVENLSKQYRLGQVSTGTLRHDLNRWWHEIRGRENPYLKIGEVNDRTKKSDSDYVWALRDLNFEVMHGEVLGIIGRNGAGKSTLLKILSRTTSPTTGSVKMKGRVASLLEVGTGFHPELSGRENIFLNGAIMGMTRNEITRRFDEMVSFSGVERYIDTPVKRYSSGMYVRLAFAVAAHLEPEILIVDEVLAVGDAEFQKKALGKMQDVSDKEGRTVLFVSHDLNAIKSFCPKTLLLSNGEVGAFENTTSVIEKYLEDNKSHSYRSARTTGSELYVEEITVSDISGKVKNIFDYKEDVLLYFTLNKAVDKHWLKGQYDLFITISDIQRRRVFSAESKIFKTDFALKLRGEQFTKGTYYLEVMVNIPIHGGIEHLKDVVKFEVLDDSSWMFKHGSHDCGCVFGNYEWL
jgi:lipopolysaccharide transport system ATP-binding protein